MAKVCLVTAGQPSTQPRLVKEADELARHGHEVVVVCGWYASWADRMDTMLLANRSWRCVQAGGHPQRARLRYLWTRLRHGVSRRAGVLNRLVPAMREWALARPVVELRKAAARVGADLYIAHNLAALPAALDAAEENGTRAGFDAEDFHSGMIGPGAERDLTREFEQQLLPRCDYVTAASPGIAEAYAAAVGIPEPAVVLNAFPLAQRPKQFRPSDPNAPVTLYWFSQSLGPERGLEDVVRAMARTGRTDLQLHLRGSCDEAYRNSLMRLMRDVRLDPGSVIFHEPAPPDEMIRLASACDVGLALEQPSTVNRDICLTNKIFAYLLAGNAVVATATRGQRPVMERIGGAGFCFEPGDVDALARQLVTWCEDRDALRRARLMAWDWGTRRYNWEHEGQAFLAVVRKVLPVQGACVEPA